MKKIIIILLALAVISCAKTTEDLDLSYDIPVVSGFLSPDDTPSIQISQMVIFDNESEDSSDIISELDVFLINTGIKYQLSPDDSIAGLYNYTDSLFTIIEDNEYFLELTYKDALISSETKIPLKPVDFEMSDTIIELERITEETTGGIGPGSDIEEIEITWTTSDNSYYLVKFEYLEDEYDPVNETIEIEDPEEFASFTSPPLQDSLYTLRPMQFRYFGQYNLILFKITDNYAAVYESINQSSLDDLTEPVTNIENGRGIFTSFNSDTLQFSVVVD
jgi:hypothetical protein